MSYCGEHTLVNQIAGVRTCVSLRCRAWTCPDCREQRRNQLIAEGCGGQPNAFLTLTLKAGVFETQQQAALALAKAWRLLRLRIMRHKPELDRWRALCKDHAERGLPQPTKPRTPQKAGKAALTPLPFMAVFESTQVGTPHLHIMMRSRFVDQKWISAQMDELIGSPIVDIRRIYEPGRVAHYVAKYAGKNPHKFGSAKRYWQSADYDLRPEPEEKPTPRPGEGWDREPQQLARYATDLQRFGWAIAWDSRWKFRATAPPVGRLRDERALGFWPPRRWATPSTGADRRGGLRP